MKANIEINDHEYLIKLKREDFTFDFLSRFMSKILAEDSISLGETAGDIITRTFHYDVSTRFDHLDDK